MQYIDKDGNRHDIPLHSVQPKISPDEDNALYESANGLKVDKVSDATNTAKGVLRFATDPEAEYSVMEDVAINAKQLKLAVPKTTLKNKVYGTDDEGKQTHYSAGDFIARVVTLPVANVGTLSADDLQTLKDSNNNVLTRANIIFHYTSSLDGKMRYSATNRYTDGLDYVYTILVDETTGEWNFFFNRMYVCKNNNVPPTTVANPSGVSGPFFYSIINDIIHLQWDGVSVSSAGTIYLWNNFPSKYLPKQGKQRCTCGIDFNSGYTNAFLYANPTGVRMKAWRASTAYWGELMWHLDF